MKTLALLCAGLLTAAGCARGAELIVHAAASLTDALKELAPAYEKQSGDKLLFNFGASSQLARQIKEGAPADVFFSADQAQMDNLDKAGLLAPGTRENLLGNTLVIVVPADSAIKIASAADLTKAEVKKVAVAEPNSVPAGVYTKEYLTRLGLWEKVLPKVLPTENVRASLAAVESGNVEAGTVYKTDALISKKVRVACEAPAAEGGPKIAYPLAALKSSKNPEAARKLLAFLGGGDARRVFVRHGFTVLK
jgi:molybdate transport system substrate-binding protein